jgi:hypothetical protein
MEMLSLTFVLLALLFYIKGRLAQRDGTIGWPWLVLSGLMAGIGMLAKETAALFPLYALVMEWTVLGFDAHSIRTRRFLITAYSLGAAACAAVFFAYVLPRYTNPAFYEGRGFDLHERLLTQLRVLPMYLGQMLWPAPSHLTFYYDDFPKSTGWLHPASTLVGGLFLLSLAISAWALRKKWPLAAMGVLWFFAAHALTSNVFNLELVFEHRNYFALLGVLLALCDLVRRIPTGQAPTLKYALAMALIAGFGLFGALRAATWGDELLLAMTLASDNPDSPRASSDLATLYVGMSGSDPQSPFYSMGKQEFERASLLPTASPLPEQGLILMAATTGQPVQAEWWDRLIKKLHTRPPGIQESLAVTGLLRQRYEGIKLDDGRLSEACSVLADRNISDPTYYTQCGDYALTYPHDEALAARMFVSAIEHKPNDPHYAAQVLSRLTEQGRTRQAEAVLRRGKQMGLFSPTSAPTAPPVSSP